MCFRYLFKRRIAIFGTTAVALCVALLIVVSSLFNGFIDSFLQHVDNQFGQVIVQTGSVPDELITKLIEHIEKQPAVLVAKETIATSGMLYLGRGKARGISIIGLDLEKECRTKYFHEGLLLQSKSEYPSFDITGGMFERANSWASKIGFPDPLPSGAIIGISVYATQDEETDNFDFAKIKKDLETNKRPMTITIGSVKQTKDGKQSFRPESIPCWPVDVVKTGYHMVDSNTIYLPKNIVKELIGLSDTNVNSNINIRVTGLDKYTTKEIIYQTKIAFSQFARDNDLPSHLISSPPVMAGRDMDNVQIITAELIKQKVVLQVILGLIFLVSALLIFVILMMIVMQKKRDIGIIRSIGSSKLTVSGIFLFYGFIVGLIGSMAGLALGIYLTHNINHLETILSGILGLKVWKSQVYWFSEIPNTVDYFSSVIIVIVSIITATTGALLPAIKAAKMNPADSVRFE